MSTVTLPETPDVARAVTDLPYYDEQIRVLSDAARKQLETAVVAAHKAATTPQVRPLGGLEKNVIAFYPHLREYRTRGEIDEAIITRLGFSATRYYQILNGLLDRPEAVKAYPGILAPLYRQREQRRTARRLTPTGSPR